MPAIDIPKERLIQVARWRVKYKDIFNLTQYYKDLHFWLEEYQWKDLEDGKDHYENLYFEKIDMTGAKEIWIKWRPYKIPNNNPYYRYWMDFDYHCIGIKDTEVVKDGAKFKAHKGEMELWFTAWMELDYRNQWTNHPILKFFVNLFPGRIFRKEIREEHKRELYREAYELQNYAKEWFKLKRHLPYDKVPHFHPGQAFPSHLK